jgi:hypothetical protein
MVLTWIAKSGSKIIRVSISALFCDSDLSTASQVDVVVSATVVNVEEGRETHTEVKINLLE